MRLLCRKFLLLLFPLLLICAIVGFTACNDDDKNSKTVLTTPQIELAENVISWTAVENADSYEVYENNTRVSQQQETSYTITKTTAGIFKYKVKAIGADKNYSPSKFSNEVIYTAKDKTQLAAPQLSLDEATKTVSWTAVENADGYEIFEDGELVSSQSETTYVITHTETGTYRYKVKAISTNSDFIASELSDEVILEITEQLATPEITLDEATKTISWTAVENAGFYAIYEDGYVIESQWSGTSYEITQTIVGIHTYCVMARGKYSVYLNSEKSNVVSIEIKPTVLETPSELKLSADKRIITWNEVKGAGSYIIFEDGIRVDTTSDPTYIISQETPGTYKYSVQAIPARGDAQYLESEISEPLEVTISDERIQLETPANVKIETHVIDPTDTDGDEYEAECLVWDPVENTDGYTVYENGIKICNTSECLYMVEALTPGSYNYQVMAVSRNMDYQSSELSAEVTHQVAENPETEFTVSLNVDSAPDFSGTLEVAFFRPDSSGLAQTMIPATETTVAVGKSAKIITTNIGKYVAKIISGLPSGYYATVANLSAAETSGNIYIYKGSTQAVYSVGSNSATISRADEPDSGLFIATQPGQYTISTNEMGVTIDVGTRNVIDTSNGITMCTFTANADEAVLISVNSSATGTYRFTIEKGAKSPSLKIGTGRGDNSNTIAGDVKEITYTLNLEETTKFRFFFGSARLGTDRFVTITVQGKTYEIDGDPYTCFKDIVIEAGNNIELKFVISGKFPDVTSLDFNLMFDVYPL